MALKSFCFIRCDALIASGGLTVAKMKECLVPGSMSRSWNIGCSVLTSRYNNEPPVDALVKQERGKVICLGKVRHNSFLILWLSVGITPYILCDGDVLIFSH